MTPQQAFEVLNQATQPGVKLFRADYVMVEQALNIMQTLVEQSSKPQTQKSDAQPQAEKPPAEKLPPKAI